MVLRGKGLKRQHISGFAWLICGLRSSAEQCKNLNFKFTEFSTYTFSLARLCLYPLWLPECKIPSCPQANKVSFPHELLGWFIGFIHGSTTFSRWILRDKTMDEKWIINKITSFVYYKYWLKILDTFSFK